TTAPWSRAVPARRAATTTAPICTTSPAPRSSPPCGCSRSTTSSTWSASSPTRARRSRRVSWAPTRSGSPTAARRGPRGLRQVPVDEVAQVVDLLIDLVADQPADVAVLAGVGERQYRGGDRRGQQRDQEQHAEGAQHAAEERRP